MLSLLLLVLSVSTSQSSETSCPHPANHVLRQPCVTSHQTFGRHRHTFGTLRGISIPTEELLLDVVINIREALSYLEELRLCCVRGFTPRRICPLLARVQILSHTHGSDPPSRIQNPPLCLIETLQEQYVELAKTFKYMDNYLTDGPFRTSCVLENLCHVKIKIARLMCASSHILMNEGVELPPLDDVIERHIPSVLNIENNLEHILITLNRVLVNFNIRNDEC